MGKKVETRKIARERERERRRKVKRERKVKNGVGENDESREKAREIWKNRRVVSEVKK